MKLTFFFIILFCAESCKIKSESINYYLSPGIENIKIFPATKHDSAKIRKIDLSTEEALEKCEKNKNSICIDDRGIMTLHAEFPKGISNFRTVLFKKIKIPKNAKEGENRVLLTIGIKDNLESVKLLKYTDKKIKDAIENVFKLEDFNTWKSARIFGIPVKEQFEISIFVERKIKDIIIIK
ncbi:hypothetical protein [Chryseobacterium daeguense]|uniref:hypothetical protein n=1 Tax=Chryseobacterium daeguense TaxID=412438 RepID=UPI0004285237|nr:hypothetical protein [Chryseobacterium daeguense]